MAILKFYQHGLTAGTPPGPMADPTTRKRVSRRRSRGWTARSCRSNVAFLRSVLVDQLPPFGLSFTLTVRDCPPTPQDWNRVCRAAYARLERAGCTCLHWVTEWQRRGFPHLHGCAYFPDQEQFQVGARIGSGWCDLASAYHPALSGQHLQAIYDPLGWSKYLAKHAARGVQHYQRAAANIPAAWQTTGRVWGYRGDWPRQDATEVWLPQEGFFRFRRIVRSWRIADARAENNKNTRRRRITSARSCLKCNVPGLTEVRGMSEWVPLSTALDILAYLSSEGWDVRS